MPALLLPVESAQPEITADDYEFIRALVYEHSRIHLGPDKKVLVSTRLAKRLRKLGLTSYEEYCRLLRSPGGPGELANLVDIISTNHTHFFREPKHFDFLRAQILPPFQRQHADPFRIWSAACSSGEEPYTLAIVLAESLGLAKEWRIDASDISTRILETASQGIYSGDRLTHVPPEIQSRRFQRGTGEWEGHFRVKTDLRQRVNFHHLNLLQPSYPFAHKFHVIFCRNVMIYFDRETQETLIRKLSDQLLPGGHLMVGHSESLSGIRHGLKTIQPALYLKA